MNIFTDEDVKKKIEVNDYEITVEDFKFVNEGKVIHDGIKYPVYLYQIDEKIEIGKDFINHPNSAFEVGMEFRTKRDLKLKLIDVINE